MTYDLYDWLLTQLLYICSLLSMLLYVCIVSTTGAIPLTYIVYLVY